MTATVGTASSTALKSFGGQKVLCLVAALSVSIHVFLLILPCHLTRSDAAALWRPLYLQANQIPQHASALPPSHIPTVIAHPFTRLSQTRRILVQIPFTRTQIFRGIVPVQKHTVAFLCIWTVFSCLVSHHRFQSLTQLQCVLVYCKNLGRGA